MRTLQVFEYRSTCVPAEKAPRVVFAFMTEYAQAKRTLNGCQAELKEMEERMEEYRASVTCPATVLLIFIVILTIHGVLRMEDFTDATRRTRTASIVATVATTTVLECVMLVVCA